MIGSLTYSFKEIASIQASGALTSYGVHAVIANILHTRKDVVRHSCMDRILEISHLPGLLNLWQRQNWSCMWINDPLQVSIVLPSGDAPRVEVINRPQNEPRIEKLLVSRVVQLHVDFLSRGRVA